MATETFLFTSETVKEDHPDKPCDQISDAVLNACLAQDPDSKIVKENFDFRPGMFTINLDLKRGCHRFLKTAAYGHFGRDDPDFTWEVVK